MPKLDAVVLAGGKVSEVLAQVTGEEYEALIPIGSRPMVEYVVQALKESENIGRIVVVGPPELSEILPEDLCQVVESGPSLVDNLLRGLEVLGSEREVLVASGDIPLLTTQAVDDFLAQTRAVEADIYYPIISRESNEARFPHVRRTYVRLREGVFTGGNLVLLDPECVYKCRQTIEQAVAMRKKPWQLARLLGFRFILKLLFNRLNLKEIEERVQLILGFVGKGIISYSPEIGIDVDKPSDLELVRAKLAGDFQIKENVKTESAPGTIDA
ncbi:MAG: NTP transferase domain-containing protein [Firmicutes bacterium]|nr:NTP transferase domain-containing protein [Bacillota bacterium]